MRRSEVEASLEGKGGEEGGAKDRHRRYFEDVGNRMGPVPHVPYWPGTPRTLRLGRATTPSIPYSRSPLYRTYHCIGD